MAHPHEMVNVYSQNQKAMPAPAGNSRETDARALLVCASRLADAKALLAADPKSKENLRIYGEALRRNQQLWTIFQVALSDAQNPLPNGLKLILLNLARYVDKTSFRAVGKYTPDLVDSLININRIIATGLSKQPTVEAMASEYQGEMRDIPTALTTSA